MDAAGKNAGLDRRVITAGTRQSGAIDGALQRQHHTAAGFVAAGQRHQRDRPTQAGDIVRGVAGAARDDLGGVVFENQHGRFARDARHPAVDELVGEQIAEYDHALAAARGNQAEEALGRGHQS